MYLQNDPWYGSSPQKWPFTYCLLNLWGFFFLLKTKEEIEKNSRSMISNILLTIFFCVQQKKKHTQVIFWWSLPLKVSCMRSELWSVADRMTVELVVRKHDWSRICDDVCMFDQTGPRPSLLSFLWGNNEQHTHARTAKIALLFTHAESHTHTLAFITLAGRKRGERDDSYVQKLVLDYYYYDSSARQMLLHIINAFVCSLLESRLCSLNS